MPVETPCVSLLSADACGVVSIAVLVVCAPCINLSSIALSVVVFQDYVDHPRVSEHISLHCSTRSTSQVLTCRFVKVLHSFGSLDVPEVSSVISYLLRCIEREGEKLCGCGEYSRDDVSLWTRQ